MRRAAIHVATLLCLLLGAASVLRVVGPENLAPGVEDPIVFDDYALQFYYGSLGSRFLERGGATHGYDPNFMAGYVKTPAYYPSSKLFEVALWLFSGHGPAAVFNWTVFALLAAGPLLMLGAAVNFGFSPGERLAVAALAILPHFLVPSAGFYGIMEAAGMVPYVFACFASVFSVSLVARFLAGGGLGAGAALAVAAPLMLLTHTSAALLCAVPMAALYLRHFRSAPAGRHAWLWAVLALALLANWPWIRGTLMFRHYADVSSFYAPAVEALYARRGGLLAPFRQFVPEPFYLSLLTPVFGLVGLVRWMRERRGDLSWAFGPQIGFLFLLTYYGAYAGLAPLAPVRFSLPLALYLVFPAAAVLAALASRMMRWLAARPPRRGAALGVTAALGLALLLLASGMPRKVWRPYSIPQLQESEGYAAHGPGFLRWLREHTDSDARILHEETDLASHRYYGSHLAALFPLRTGRLFANGPVPYPLVRHNYLRFNDGTLLGRPLADFSAEELAPPLELYNVRWVLCWSDAAKRTFAGLPLARHVADYERFALFELRGRPSWFARGDGSLELRDGRLVLEGLVPEQGAVTLKYHWLETLRSRPPARLEPVFLLDDPVPFIQVVDPPDSLEIFDDYGLGVAEVLARQLPAGAGPGGARGVGPDGPGASAPGPAGSAGRASSAPRRSPR